MRYLSWQRDAKEKTVFSSDSKLTGHTTWNESKTLYCSGSKRSLSTGRAASIIPTNCVAVSAIAANRVAWIARAIFGGVASAEPSKDAPGVPRSGPELPAAGRRRLCTAKGGA
jgi:hypothetical protein